MLAGLESPMHLLVVLVIALMVLGPKRLPEAGRGLGSALRNFRQAVSEPETLGQGHVERPAKENAEQDTDA
jgi:sec-independent protein translocase protein TatA